MITSAEPEISNPSPLSLGAVLKSYYFKVSVAILLWSTSIGSAGGPVRGRRAAFEHQQHLGLLGEGPPARFMSVAGTNQQPSRRLQHLAASLRPRSASGTGMATGAAHKLLGAWLDPAQRIGTVRL